MAPRSTNNTCSLYVNRTLARIIGHQYPEAPEGFVDIMFVVLDSSLSARYLVNQKDMT